MDLQDRQIFLVDGALEEPFQGTTFFASLHGSDLHGLDPTHPWLFDLKVSGPTIEKEALPVPSKDWKQILPTYQAKALVAYLQSLHSDYSLPEAPLK